MIVKIYSEKETNIDCKARIESETQKKKQCAGPAQLDNLTQSCAFLLLVLAEDGLGPLSSDYA